jgi:hypothetical protein
MATYLVPPNRVTLTSGADLSGSLYRLVVLNTSNQVVLPGAAGADCIGVLDDLGPGNGASGSPVTVIIGGGAKLEANAAISVGADLVAGATTGRAATAATTGHRRIGKAYEAAGAQGDIISVIIDRDGAV